MGLDKERNMSWNETALFITFGLQPREDKWGMLKNSGCPQKQTEKVIKGRSFLNRKTIILQLHLTLSSC